MASWLMRSTPDRAVHFSALIGDIVLCSRARHLTLTRPLSSQVYKRVPANLILGRPSHEGGSGWGERVANVSCQLKFCLFQL